MEAEPTVNLKDEDGRSLPCHIENSMKIRGEEYVLLLPVDAPIEIFAWADDEEAEDEEGEMLIDIDEEELDDVFATARAVLAEQDLILNRTALTLTASGEIPPSSTKSRNTSSAPPLIRCSSLPAYPPAVSLNCSPPKSFSRWSNSTSSKYSKPKWRAKQTIMMTNLKQKVQNSK
jgi:Protein of unknown function (DUF1292)